MEPCRPSLHGVFPNGLRLQAFREIFARPCPCKQCTANRSIPAAVGCAAISLLLRGFPGVRATGIREAWNWMILRRGEEYSCTPLMLWARPDIRHGQILRLPRPTGNFSPNTPSTVGGNTPRPLVVPSLPEAPTPLS